MPSGAPAMFSAVCPPALALMLTSENDSLAGESLVLLAGQFPVLNLATTGGASTQLETAWDQSQHLPVDVAAWPLLTCAHLWIPYEHAGEVA